MNQEKGWNKGFIVLLAWFQNADEGLTTTMLFIKQKLFADFPSHTWGYADNQDFPDNGCMPALQVTIQK